MTFEQFQEKARKTAMYPSLGNISTYPVLGLCGETGEVAEKFKKLVRDKNSQVDEEFLISIKKELGDVLWYLSNICSDLNLSFADVAQTNIDKLMDRKARGVIQGSGDNR